LRTHQQEITSKGASLAAIGLGDVNYARAFRDETDITFPLLIDADRKAYRAVELKKANLFHLLRSDNAAARKRAKAGGFSQKKLGENPFQLGGSFVFAPGNVDKFVQISQTFGDNAAIADLVAAL
jgi:alkyl-hydroperoxide reductase/thiol specific antioxidant family protein